MIANVATEDEMNFAIGCVVAVFVGVWLLCFVFEAAEYIINKFYNIIWALCWPIRLPFVILYWVYTHVKNTGKKEALISQDTSRAMELISAWKSANDNRKRN